MSDTPRARLLAAQRRLAADPTAWADALELVAALPVLGRDADARTAALYAVRRHPDVGAVHLALGHVEAARGAAALAERAFAAATRTDPTLVEAWLRLGTTRFRRGDIAGAEAPLREAWGRAPADPGARVALASVCLRTRAVEEARALLAPLVDGAPGPEVVSTWARVCLALGRPAEALAPLAAARAANPMDAVLCFAAGDVHDRIGAHEAAFAAYTAGNRAMGGAWDPAAHDARVGAQLQAFDRATLAAAARAPTPAADVLLIVGMPRSGTSLLEQALACHPAIAGGGELDLLRPLSLRLSAALGAPGRWFSRPADVTAAVYAQLSQAYRAELARRAGPGTLRIDKTPDNALHLGLAHLVLPGVRVVHLDRDARDAGWSCFRQAFGDGLAWSRDLSHIAAYRRTLDRAMAHWDAALPEAPLRVRYADLVGDAEATLRRVLAFLGLPWDPAVLRPHESRRLVTTASHGEVQQALHTSSVGRSAPYRAWLGPLHT